MRSPRQFRTRTASPLRILFWCIAGSIPITTSGKIRRSSCVDLYQRKQFLRLDA